jgi:hypothetical protein
MASCCYIVPPHLLRAIANAPVNATTIRQAAQQSLAHRDRITTERENRLSILSQPRGYRGAMQQLNARQSIVPDILLRHLAESSEVDEETRQCARRDLEHLEEVHGRYQATQQGDLQPDQGTMSIASASGKKKADPDKVYRAVYDMKHSQIESKLPGTLVRAEGQKEVKDKAVNDAFDNAGKVIAFYKDKFKWNSIDNKGMQVISSVHFGKNYENACE